MRKRTAEGIESKRALDKDRRREKSLSRPDPDKVLTKSEQMSRVRSRDTEPELHLRQLLTQRGVRYRLHRTDLPGKPDIYIGRLSLAVFVNGCFWHGHACSRGRHPRTNVAFWDRKITANVARDERSINELRSGGIHSEVLWTCQRHDFVKSANRIARRYRISFGVS